MMKIDNSIYRAGVVDYQDNQEREIAACRDFYRHANVNRISILDADEVEEPLEKTRIHGPFSLDILRWVRMNPFVVLMVDADGKECIEY